MSSVRAAIVALVFSAFFTAPRSANGDDTIERRRECARTSEDGQRQRSESHLRVARQRFLVCGQDDCPDFVRRDCRQWLEEVDLALPTIVLVVHDARGDDAIGAKVLLDGAPLEAPVGTAVTLDPGAHTLRAELPDGTVLTREIQAAETVKNRVVVLEPRDSALRPGNAPPRTDGAARRAGSPSSAATVAGYALLGTSAVLVGVTAYLGLDGLSRAHDLRDSCKPNCDPDDVDSVRSQFRVSYLTGALAGLAFAGGLYLTLLRPRSTGVQFGLRSGPARMSVVLDFP